MAKEKTESTQISWDMVGSRLVATIPVVNERVEFDLANLHESWLLFIKGYGVQQHASSFLAKFSFSAGDDLKVELATAKKMKDEKAVEAAREKIRLAKVEWLKTNAPKLRTELFNQMKLYAQPMPEKSVSSRESKAEVEARVKAEMIATMRAKFEAAGFDEATIETLLKGV